MPMASSTSSVLMIPVTGPKISSWAIRVRLLRPEDGRPEEVALRPCVPGELFPGEHRGALLLPDLDVFEDPVLLLVDHRRQLDAQLQAAADLHAFDPGEELVGELLSGGVVVLSRDVAVHRWPDV